MLKHSSERVLVKGLGPGNMAQMLPRNLPKAQWPSDVLRLWLLLAYAQLLMYLLGKF